MVPFSKEDLCPVVSWFDGWLNVLLVVSFIVGWLVVVLVVGLITQNLGWRTGLSPEKTPVTWTGLNYRRPLGLGGGMRSTECHSSFSLY